MANDSSEEKTLPPSRKKLNDARKKGQVPKSKDLSDGVAMSASLLYLLVASGGIMAAAIGMLERSGELAAGNFQLGLAAMGPAIREAVTRSILPLLVIPPVLVVLSSMAVLRGIPFAVDPISPKMERINPAEGFKRMFQIRSLIELVKTLIKAAVVIAAMLVILRGGLNALVLVPSCGDSCVTGALGGLGRPLIEAAAGLFLVAGLADVGLQRWLFMRDQKMSISELKRERKDMDGDPHLQQERKRIMREAVRLSAGLGIKRATLVVHDGGRICVGLRYMPSEMSAPAVVSRARDDRSAAMVAQARLLALPLIEDHELATSLAGVPLAHGIPERLFRPVALALARSGMTLR